MYVQRDIYGHTCAPVFAAFRIVVVSRSRSATWRPTGMHAWKIVTANLVPPPHSFFVGRLEYSVLLGSTRLLLHRRRLRETGEEINVIPKEPPSHSPGNNQFYEVQINWEPAVYNLDAVWSCRRWTSLDEIYIWVFQIFCG